MTVPFIGNTRPREGGIGVTTKQDFLAHIEGGFYKHNASHIDLAASLPGLSATQVQEALEQIIGALNSSEDNGFVSIGLDGYTSGTYNVGSVDTPTLEDAFNAAFANTRLSSGGVILLMAGHYILTQTISVPSGITIMGELAGTYISGNMLSPTSPMFLINYPTSYPEIGGNSGGGNIIAASGSNVGKTKFFNIVLLDHFGTSGATMTSAGMIHVQKGANFECERVSFLGKLNNGAITNRLKTIAAIATTSGNTSGTSISINFCYIDGVRNGVLFGTSAGDADFLSITNTKGRWYGTENISYSNKTDCFVDTTLCNLTIADCYLLGGGNHASLIANIENSGGTISTLRYSFTNIRGQNGPGTIGKILNNDSPVSSLRGVISGNTWGSHIHNEWYITIGSSDSGKTAGDIYGTNALDLVLTYANIGNFTGTVIINSGNYTINGVATAANNFMCVKLIGNPSGNELPIITINLTNKTSTDILVQPQFTVGNYLENICFKSSDVVHSIRPSYNASNISNQRAKFSLFIKNCYFKDITCNILGVIDQPTDIDGVPVKLTTVVENCYFHQTGNFNPSISLVAPKADVVEIKNSFFTGAGYAIAIGDNYPGSYAITSTRAVLQNVKVDMTGYQLITTSPGAHSSNVYIESDNVEVSDCSFLTSNSLNAITNAIDSGFASGGEYEDFVRLAGERVIVKGSLFNGPNQVYPVSSLIYAMKTLSVLPTKSLQIEDSKFIGGATGCYIASTLTNGSVQENITIKNNSFVSTGGATESVSQTLLDIDIDSAGTVVSTVNILDNTFYNNSIANPFRTQHIFNTGGSFLTNAVVQIYCKGCNTNVRGNLVRAELNTLQDADPSDCYSGIAINTFISDAGTSSFTTSAQINNNIVKIQSNNTSNGSSSSIASCISVVTNLLTLTDNDLNMHNITVSSSFAGCLALDVRILGSSGKGLVRGNHFGRAPVTGSVTTSLSRGYIYIASTNTIRGFITENNFDSSTFNGSSNVLIEDNSSLEMRKWMADRNINQIKTMIITGGYGSVSLDTSSVFAGLSAAGDVEPTAANSSALITDETSVRAVAFVYGTGSHGNTVSYKWIIPIIGLIPDGASILSISASVDLTVNASTLAAVIMNWVELGVAQSIDANLTLTTTGDTLGVAGLSPGFFRSVTANSPTLHLLFQINSSSDTTATVTPITITYTY